MKHSCMLWILSYSHSQLGWTNSKNFSVSSSNAQEAWTSYSTKVCKQLLLTVDSSHGRPFPSGPFYHDIDFAHYHVRPCLFATDLLNAHSLYSLLLDFCIYNPFTARPPFEIGFLTVLSIFWMGKSESPHWSAGCLLYAPQPSTLSRLRVGATSRLHVAISQLSMPTSAVGVAICKRLRPSSGLNGLFVSCSFLTSWCEAKVHVVILTGLFTLRFVIRESNAGNKHIWSTALSRYFPYNAARIRDNENISRDAFHERSSSFFVSDRSIRI